MGKTVYDVLIEQFEEERKGLSVALSNGVATDFPAYREMVGRIRGLQSAIKTTTDLARQQLEDDDE